MADAGDIWFRALSSFGNNAGSGIADAIKIYHDREEKLRLADATMAELSQTMNPSTGKPVIDQKAYEEYLNHSDKQRAVLFGAKIGAQKVLEQYGHAATATANAATAGARSQIAQRAVDTPLFDFRGNTYQNTATGVKPLTASQAELNAIKEARIAAHQAAGLAIKRRKEIDTTMMNSPLNMNTDQFLQQKVVPGVVGEDGVTFTPQAGGPDGAIEYPGKDGSTYTPIKGQDYSNYLQLADEYKKLGATAFGGLTGGKQNAPVMVNTPDDARKLPPGTLYQTPDGKIYQIPAQ